MSRRCSRCWLPLLTVFAGLLLEPRAVAQSNEFRGAWVDAWGVGFLNATEVTQLIADCRTYNYNAIVVQMRRRGDAFYNNLVPGNDPKTTAISGGFDALQDLITKAHTGSPRIQVHCWVTTHVIWSGLTPPSQPGHVFNSHPEYLMRDSTGTNFLAEGFYLDPGHPDATLWNYIMATNIVRRYDVDGFHWDYIRYPQLDSGYNPTAIARYNAEFGLSGQPAPADAQFANWRRRQVTDFLRWVNSDLLAYKSNLVVSCAVFGSRSDAYNNRFQDWAAWNGEGIIDICMPMGYTADNALFQTRVTDAFNNQGVRRVYSGQGAYLNTKENTAWQLNYIRSKPLLGSVLYSYRVPNSGTVDRPGTLAYLKNNFQTNWVDVPAIPWKATPTKGIIRGTITRLVGGTAVYNATLSLNTVPPRIQRTEPHGKFAFFEVPPGNYTITVSAADLATATGNLTIAAGQNLAASVALPPDNTPPLISSVAADDISDTFATIQWTTDEASNSAVDFGPTLAYGSLASNATMTVNHSIPLTNLIPNTQYHFRVRSRNPTGLQTNSVDFTFFSNPPGVVADVIIESYLANGTLNVNPPYADTGFALSTLKSSAAGLVATNSRYGSSGSPSFTITPTLPVAGGYYDVFLTHGNATSLSDDIMVAVGQSGCTGLPATTTIFREPGANTWESLGRLKLNPGVSVPVVTFTHSSGVLSGTARMYSDAIKFVYLSPPIITGQPQNKNVNQGGSATFSMTAAGASPLAFQWRFEGTNINGATSSNYIVMNAQPAQEGDYSVVITNVAGAVTSAVAALTVNLPPSIAAPPQAQTVRVGQDATFTVSTGGTEPLSYQWRFNGANLAGATEDQYARSSAQTNHAGSYLVVVTNVAGAVTSAPALLTVEAWLPVHFQSINQLPDGRMHLVVTGSPGETLWIDRTNDLPPNWNELTNLPNQTGSLQFIDGSSTNQPRGFYRARQ